MRNDIPVKNRALALIERLRQPLVDPVFWSRHRRRARDFTRECVLTFPVLMLMLLQKSLKSLQTHMQEFLGQLADGAARPTLSGGVLTPARAKLCASAFVELNESAALVQRWQGHRLLGVDSSRLRLPSRAAEGEKLGRGQETYSGRLKGRFDLEHCSGQTLAAVEQAFHAPVLLSNVESVVVGPVQAQLAERNVRRREFSPSRSYHYQRRVRKLVF